MTMRTFVAVLASGLVAWTPLMSQESATPRGLSAEEFAGIHELCKLKTTESAWDKLPWETNVWRAVTKASREKKLVLVWSAGGGGHPLGMC